MNVDGWERGGVLLMLGCKDVTMYEEGGLDWGMESLECGIISVRLWLCLSGTPMNHALRKAFLSDGTKPEPERLLDFDI
jgi:hypothetical protein